MDEIQIYEARRFPLNPDPVKYGRVIDFLIKAGCTRAEPEAREGKGGIWIGDEHTPIKKLEGVSVSCDGFVISKGCSVVGMHEVNVFEEKARRAGFNVTYAFI